VQQCDVFGSVAVDVIDMFSPGEVGGEGQAHKLQKRLLLQDTTSEADWRMWIFVGLGEIIVCVRVDRILTEICYISLARYGQQLRLCMVVLDYPFFGPGLDCV
jgi:hypothetical protein